MAHRLFVYGTLKRKFFNNRILLEFDSQFQAVYRSVDKWPMVVGRWGVPYLLPLKGNGHQITGEIWEVDDKGLEALDVLEGLAQGLYTRETIAVSPIENPAGVELAQAYVKTSVDNELLGLPYVETYSIEEHSEKYVPQADRPVDWHFLNHTS